MSMKRIVLALAAIILLAAATGNKEKEQDSMNLESGFSNPPAQARPHT